MAKIWFGTSGFSYKEWKGKFYPEDVPDREMLKYYATRLNSVEIDSTFYRMPTVKSLEAWRTSTPDEFRFTIKASQQITHRQRLKVPSDALDYFVGAVPSLGGRLGLVLFQLPPFFHCDASRLEAFLSTLPRGVPSAFEFRHESWFTPAIYALLERFNTALCIHDADDHTTPLQLTANAVYVRLRRSVYTPAQREEWQQRLRDWAEGGAEVFAYIKHEDNPDAPLIALEFAAGLTS
jgi:uncharacterized protein YecE (DUF72 family)